MTRLYTTGTTPTRTTTYLQEQNSAVTLSFLVRNPPQYLSSNKRESRFSLLPRRSVSSSKPPLPNPQPRCVVQHADCTSAAPRRSTKTLLADEYVSRHKTNSLLVFPATAASWPLRLLFACSPPPPPPTSLPGPRTPVGFLSKVAEKGAQ
jgi:hypothetical protein